MLSDSAKTDLLRRIYALMEQPGNSGCPAETLSRLTRQILIGDPSKPIGVNYNVRLTHILKKDPQVAALVDEFIVILYGPCANCGHPELAHAGGTGCTPTAYLKDGQTSQRWSANSMVVHTVCPEKCQQYVARRLTSGGKPE